MTAPSLAEGIRRYMVLSIPGATVEVVPLNGFEVQRPIFVVEPPQFISAYRLKFPDGRRVEIAFHSGGWGRPGTTVRSLMDHMEGHGWLWKLSKLNDGDRLLIDDHGCHPQNL